MKINDDFDFDDEDLGPDEIDLECRATIMIAA
jgi:hypothetical protein